MDFKFEFLKNVLGSDGAQALEKSVAKLPDLANIVIPYAVSSWLNMVGDYEGHIPGVDNSNLEIVKSEDKYTGTLSVSEFNYEFSQAKLPEVVAVLGMVLGIESYKIDNNIKKSEVSSLCKNIDLLIKFTIDELEKSAIAELEKAVPVGLARAKMLNGPQAGHTTTNQGGMINKPAAEAGIRRVAPYELPSHEFKQKVKDPSFRAYLDSVNIDSPKENHFHGLDQQRKNQLTAKDPEKYRGHIDAAGHHLAASGAARQIATLTPSAADKAHFEGKAAFHQQMAKLHQNHAASQMNQDKRPIMSRDVTEYNAQKGMPIPDRGNNFRAANYDSINHAEEHYNKQNPMMLIGKAHPFDQHIKNTSPAHNAIASVRMHKSELNNRCDTCGETEFTAQKFTGCLCFKDLAKHELKVVPDGKDYVVLHFGEGWAENEDAVSAVLAVLKPVGV